MMCHDAGRLGGGLLQVLVMVGVLAAGSTMASPERWEEAIKAFEKADRKDPPARGGVLFIGSSSIRGWRTLERDFPEWKVINRGFGGSEIRDSIHFASRIVHPYEPRQIVLYAGDNDIANGKSAEKVAKDFQEFTETVWGKLPETKIAFIAIKPSLARWQLVEEMRAANGRIREMTEKDARLDFIDIDGPMMNEEGRPRPELFAEDGLHLNDEGYRVWTEVVRAVLIPSRPEGIGSAPD